MKVVDEQIRRITISDVKCLDPIRVALEDLGQGKGRINIECYGQSWANYWGAMGNETIAEFFTSCNVHYIAGKLSNIESNIFDPDGLKETLQRSVIQERRHRWITKEEARKKFETIDDLDLPEHEAQLWAISDQMHEVMGDEWWYSLPKKTNPDYEYLTRIIEAVQEALSQLLIKEAA